MKPTLKLYNTLSRKLEIFKPLKGKSVGLYTCGPTVYNYAHVGNLRTYVFEDILERVLRLDGYSVKRVMNITDVGHLTGDADGGEDKIEREARSERKTPAQIAAFYTKAFLADLKHLNVLKPKILAPATKYIKEQQAMIAELVKGGYAYETLSAVYFDVTKFKDYGRLSGQSLEEKNVAARGEVVTDSKKKHPADFALWFKRTGRFKNHLLHWDSPWGDGFPGWHIECSAISRKFLGQPFDIHTGGVDHIGTHHENEIAQAEAAYGKPLAKYWLHGAFLTIHNARMGKSEGNFITLNELAKKTATPLTYRYLLLGAHYRSPMSFSWESLQSAEEGLENLYRAVFNLARLKTKPLQGEKKDYAAEFAEAVNEDLNTAKALAVLWHMLADKHLGYSEKIKLLRRFDSVLALGLTLPLRAIRIEPKIQQKFEEYKELRLHKQFIQSDALRRELNRLGYVVEDTAAGSVLRPSSLLHAYHDTSEEKRRA